MALNCCISAILYWLGCWLFYSDDNLIFIIIFKKGNYANKLAMKLAKHRKTPLQWFCPVHKNSICCGWFLWKALINKYNIISIIKNLLCIYRQSFHYLEQFSSSIPNITTAVSLTKLLVILSERGQDFDNGMNAALGRLWFVLICCLNSNSSTVLMYSTHVTHRKLLTIIVMYVMYCK